MSSLVEPHMVRVSRIAAPVTVLGPGRRIALWVQGCTIGCAGCASTDTWDSLGGVAATIQELGERIVEHAVRTGATGLSITGGEPFQQAEPLSALIDEVRAIWPSSELDVLVFTGYAENAARRISPALWACADIVVAGPYRADRPSAHPLLGSANQTIHVRTPRGESSMERLGLATSHVQVAEQDGTLHLIGMPKPGDLDLFRKRLAQRGVSFDAVSWER